MARYNLSPRSLALLLLQKDPDIWSTLKQNSKQQQEIEILLTVTQNQLKYPVDLAIAEARQKQARSLEARTIQATKPAQNSFKEILHRFTVNPLTGFPILMIILYFGVYKLFPGKSGEFYLEIPPLRLPKLGNILTKTWIRMKWYFWEILPLFIWASVFIWLGKLTGIFDLIVRGIEPFTVAMGMPAATAPVFLYGFFRRDYGAAGLFDMQQQGSLTGNQLVIAAIVLTLFLPCIAQLQIMIKERGVKTTIAMIAFIIPFAFGMGYCVNLSLNILGVSL